MKSPNRQQSMAKSKIPIIAKLTPPQLQNVLERTRLFKELDRLREQNRVIWIQGPPGAGKTTLVASYLQARKLRPLWYQVDEGDADPGTWFHYLSLGMKTVAPRYKKPLPSLSPDYLPGISVFTRRFFEQLYSRLKFPNAVVFDNFQEVPNKGIFHELMYVALSTIPEETTVIIVSREHPPENFSRLQADQHLVIVAPATLTLTLHETKALLHLRAGSTGQTRGDDWAEMLYTRTQGWLAGLVLLLAQHEHKTTSLSDTVTDEVAPVVFDYFASQVFTQQNREQQDFLLQTAFFTSMTAIMAEQVTGDQGAKHYLAELARSQYFTERRAVKEYLYQYHPLFREFLLTRIQEIWKSEHIQALQRKTAEILKQNGRYEESFKLFLGIKDFTEVVSLILDHSLRLLTEGRSLTVEQWISSLPEGEKTQHPWVLFWLAQCQVLTNPNLGADTFEQSFNLFRDGNDTLGVYSAWCGVVEAIIRTWERLPRLKSWVDQLPKLEVQFNGYPNQEIEARVAVNMFNALVWCRPDDHTIYRWEAKALEVVEHIPDVNARIPALCFLFTFRTHMGDVAAGEALFNRGESWLEKQTLSPFSQAMFLVITAVNRWLAVDFEGSIQAVETGLALAEEHGLAFVPLPLLDQGITAMLLKGNLKQAKLLAKDHWMIAQCLTGFNKATSFDIQGWLAFVDGDHDTAIVHYGNALQLYHSEGHLFFEGFTHWMLGQLKVERGEFDNVQNHITHLENILHRFPSHFLKMFLYMLKALWSYANECEAAAEGHLREWLEQLRTHQTIVCHGSMPHLYARLCVKALEFGIEVKYVRDLVRKLNLVPEYPYQTSDSWPWPVRVYTLGCFVVLGEAGMIPFGRKIPKTPLALLKLLIALGGKDVSQNQVTEWLWEDAEGDAAYRSLVTTLSRLRKLLNREDAILFSGGALSINSEVCWVDSHYFQHLADQSKEEGKQGNEARSFEYAERAQALYKGDFLPHDDDSWTLPIREKLEKRVRVLRERVNQLSHYETRQ